MQKIVGKNSFEAEFDLQCSIIPKVKVLMLTPTKEQHCGLMEPRKTLEVRAEAYGSRLSKVRYVTDLEKNQQVGA